MTAAVAGETVAKAVEARDSLILVDVFIIKTMEQVATGTADYEWTISFT